MDTAFDNSNGATLDNLNQDIFQKSNVLADGDLDMDIKNTNITTAAIDTLNNIQSYTIDNQKSSELIDQNRISNDDYIIDENNQHSQVHHTAPLNGKSSEFNASDNDFGPESNVDDDTTTDSPVTEEFNEKNDDAENNVNIFRPDELVAPHGIHFENIDFLNTVDEGEECDIKKDVDVADHHERNFDGVKDFDHVNKMFSDDIVADFVAESTKLVDAVLPEKIEDPIEDPIQPENVIVPESGEESEDEWNYIKVNQNANETETPERIINLQETVESLCPDLLNDNQTQDDEIVGIEESSLSEADMASPLNPYAKEFVPTTPSPTNTTPINSFDLSGVTATMATLRLQLEDEMVSQSPRKGNENAMVDDPVPEENDFLTDITQRPADLDSTVMSDIRPGSSSSQCSYQEMNLKEAMHGDEKQEYAPDVLNTPDLVAFDVNSTNGDHEEFINVLNKSMRNQDVMNASFYNDGTSDSNNPFKVDLNAVHRLPTSDDENEEERVEGTTGTTYSFEDTEFGMNDFIQMDQKNVQNGASGIENGVNSGEPKSNEADSIVGAVQEMISEKMAVLDECNLSSSEPLVVAENFLSTTTENIIASVGEMEEPVVETDSILVEAENSTSPTAVEEPVVPIVSSLISEQFSVPEQQPNIVVEDESTTGVANASSDVVEAESEPIAETIVPETTAVAVGAAAAIAVGAVAAVATTKAKSTKPAEPKSKIAPVAAAKKPLSAGLTTKPKAKPSTVTDTTATKTVPIPRPRTVPSQPPTKAIEKKPVSSLAAKKPVNGDVKSTTTVSAAKRPVSSTTTLKSTTSARAATSTTSTTTTRVTAARLTTKTSTTTTTAAEAPKRVTATRTTTTTSSTLKPRPSSTVTKSPISKANTSATDKAAKDTVNKLQTSGARAPVSPRSTTATSRTGTVPAKKADAAKVPSAPAPIRRPISSTLGKSAPVTTANSKLTSTQKRPTSSLTTNRSTTLETVKKTTTTSNLKKDAKSQANETKETKPKENGNGTNGTHDAFDMPIEINDAVNVEQEPVIL